MVSDLFWTARGTVQYLVSIRFEVRGGFRLDLQWVDKPYLGFQSALRFAVVSDLAIEWVHHHPGMFQSALRLAVVSDWPMWPRSSLTSSLVSIRFEVRGGFRPARLRRRIGKIRVSIRFEVRGGFRRGHNPQGNQAMTEPVSIRFEVRGGFRPGFETS